MKKKLISFVFVLFAVTALFAWQNNYSYDSYEYKTLKTLKNMSGTEFPSVTFPITSANMNSLLEMIDYKNLPSEGKALYDNLYNELNNPEVVAGYRDFGVDVHVPVIIADTWVNSNGVFDVYDIDVDLYFSPYFSGAMTFNGTVKPNGEDTLGSKLHVASLNSIKHMLQTWPKRAYGSVGNENFNLTIGRDVVEAGNGITGNLYLSGNQLYNDYAKFSFINGPIAYDFTALAYDRYADKNNPSSLMVPDFESPSKTAFVHRISATLYNKLTVSAYEGAVMYGSGNLFDLRVLNPFMFIHNMLSYYTGNTNNFAGVEFDYAIGSGLSAHVQALVDQFKLGNEVNDSGDNAFGFLANINGSWIVRDVLVNAYAEGVYIGKNTYLKESYSKVYDPECNYPYFYIDMVADNCYFDASAKSYMGYPLGSNLVAFRTGASAEIAGQTLSASLFISGKGPYGIRDDEQRACDLPVEKELNNVETTFGLNLGAEGSFYKGFNYNTELSFVGIKNYKHAESSSIKPQIQFRLGGTFDLTDWVLNRFSLSR